MSDKIVKENTTNCVHPNRSYKGEFIKFFCMNLAKSMYLDLVPYTSDMKTTKGFLLETMNMILRYISEINEHDSPVS